jgi:hypothetical protein
MFNNLKKWCHKWPGLAVLLLGLLTVMVLVFGFLGLIGKFKLDRANTNLWASRQTVTQLRQDAHEQSEEYEGVIEELRAELAALKGAEAVKATMNRTESLTPEKAYKFTSVAGVVISVVDGEPNVRPSPKVSEVSYGKLWGAFTLEYFYSYPRLPQEGIGNWIGIPVHLLSETERNLFPSDMQDKDGIVWVSADYLKFSDWLKNYPANEVNLKVDMAAELSNAN